MANKKSIVEIDIQDGAWQRFAAEFARFKNDTIASIAGTKAATAEQAKLTEEKKKTDAAQKALEKADKTARTDKAKTDKEAAAIAKRKADGEKKRSEEQRKTRAADIQHLKESAKWTADVARNTAKTALNAAKWVTFSAIASGFGLGGLAASAGSARRSAQGLGINTGELRAANVNFGKYIDPESTLGNIAGAQSDLSKQWVFNALGENTKGKNAGDILPEILPKIVAAFKAGGSTLQGAQGRGLTELVGIEDLRRLSTLTEKELGDTIAAYKKDRASLDVGDDAGKAWQDFMVSLKRAGEGIEVNLIKSLKSLLPFLEGLAKGISAAINAFVSSGRLQEWIKAVGAGLEKLGDYLGSQQFQDDVKNFMDAIHTMATFLGKIFPKVDDPRTPAGVPDAGKAAPVSAWQATKDVYGAIFDHLTGKTPLAERNHNPGNLRVPGSATAFQSFGSDNDGIKALAHQLSLYENRDHLTTVRGIISKYAPGSENNTAAYIANVSKRTGLGADQQIDPANLDQMVKLVLAITKQENGRSNFTDAGVRVLIQNTTGGSAHASVAALAGG